MHSSEEVKIKVVGPHELIKAVENGLDAYAYSKKVRIISTGREPNVQPPSTDLPCGELQQLVDPYNLVFFAECGFVAKDLALMLWPLVPKNIRSKMTISRGGRNTEINLNEPAVDVVEKKLKDVVEKKLKDAGGENNERK